MHITFKTLVLPVVAAVAAGFALTPTLSNAQAKAATIDQMKGKPVPAFTSKTLDGKTISNKDLMGKVTILDFFATWCGPCKQAAPAMEKLHKAHASKGLKVIGMNGWEEGNAKTAVSNYVKSSKHSYLFTYENDKLMESWGLQGVPTFVVVDKKGVIRDVQVGWDPQSSPAKMEALVARLLKE